MSTPVVLPDTEDALTNEEGTAIIQNWLNQRLRITITDSRSFEGWFKCVDRDANIVLSGAEEFRDDQQRFIGLIVVPGKHVTQVDLIHPARQSQYLEESI